VALTGLSLAGLHAGILFVDDEGPSAAADDLRPRDFLEGAEGIAYMHAKILHENRSHLQNTPQMTDHGSVRREHRRDLWFGRACGP
jgi:hypothetical protein